MCPSADTSPLRIRSFRRVWAGATISSTGDAASWIALVSLALGPAHASLPVLAVLYTAPVAAGGLLSGWALDRFDRRKLLIADSLVRAAAFATVPAAVALGVLRPGQLYAVAGVYGALKMTSLAGFPAMIPSLVPARLLTQANALEGASFGLASLAGAALAGLAVATVGPGFVIAFDVVSYLVFACALASIPGARPGTRGEPSADQAPPAERTGDQVPVAERTGEQVPPAGPRGGRRSAARRHGGGSSGLGPALRNVLAHPWLRGLTIMFALFNVGEGALLVALPHRSVSFGLGTAGYGWFVTTMTGGELVATALLARLRWPWPLPPSIVVAELAAALLVLPLAAPFPAAAFAALLALGICTAPMTAWAQTLRMAVIPAGQRGRVFALLRTIMQATPPVGAPLTSLLLPHGPAVTFAVIAVVMGAPAVLLAPDVLRRQHRGARLALPQ